MGKNGMKKSYDVVVVGGGIAGLTAAAYCARAGLSVLLCEKQDRVGGLVNSFNRNGFVYDQGIRAIENSGIVFPMLKQLGIEMTWVRSLVTLAIADQKVVVTDTESLVEYQKMLQQLFPESVRDIELIMAEIRQITRYMDVLYGIDNPLFLDNYQDLGYVRKTLLPWLMRYLGTIGKIDRLSEPVVSYLGRFTKNRALIDIIAQHFFTPGQGQARWPRLWSALSWSTAVRYGQRPRSRVSNLERARHSTPRATPTITGGWSGRQTSRPCTASSTWDLWRIPRR